MYGKSRMRSNLIMLAVCVGVMLFQGLCFAAEKTDEEAKPERSIGMAAEHPGVEVASDKDKVSIDLIFFNKGRSDENVKVQVAQKPESWKAQIKTWRYAITGLHVPAEDEKTVTLEAEPGKDVKPGTYTFRVEAETLDGQFKMAQDLIIRVKEKEETEKTDKGVKLTTSYPVLRGPTDAKFEFSIEVDSKLDQEAVFDLVAQGPEGWDINFKPAYEEKFISSIRLKENTSRSVALVVKPGAKAKAGEYPVTVRVTSGDAKGEAKLMVMLTGTYGLEVGTPTGLLSLDARQGKTANMSMYIKNTGSNINKEIQFASAQPENWQVQFNPAKIPTINPGELKQVEIAITPYGESPVGDYAIGVNVEGEKVTRPMEFRVTVRASTAWGWIGIGIIVLVVLGLTGLFRWLGRR